jgi:hypothetical protein
MLKKIKLNVEFYYGNLSRVKMWSAVTKDFKEVRKTLMELYDEKSKHKKV